MPNSDPTVGMRDVTELSDLVVTGELSLQDVGRIVTSTDTGVNRIVISATGNDSIYFAHPTGDWARIVGGGSSAAAGNLTLYPGSNGSSYGTVYLIGPVSILDEGANPMITVGPSSAGIILSTDYSMVGGSVSTYDPVLQVLTGTSQPSVGATTGFVESGLYSQMGPQVIAHVTICWSSAGTPGNGVYVICPPKKIHSSLIVGGSVGGGRILDASGNDTWVVDARKAGSTKVNLRFTGTTGSNVTNASPFACGSSDDQFDIHLSYLTTE